MGRPTVSRGRHGADAKGASKPAGRSGAPVSDTSPLEWAVAAAGGLLLAGAIGYLAWQGFATGQGTPDLVVQEVGRDSGFGGHRVAIRVRNVGRAAAAQVLVAGELREALGPAGPPVEESETMLDYVAADSDREAWLVFTRDPACCTLTLRVKGMAKP